MRWSAKARCTSSSAPGTPGRPPSPQWIGGGRHGGPAAQSLAQLRDKINSRNAGVTASVLTDASGSRLIGSSATGEANGFKVSVDDIDGNNTKRRGLSALAFDPRWAWRP